MKALLHLLAGGLMLAALPASAQQFINGGFEPKTPLGPCNEVTVIAYNTNMGGNWYIGSGDKMKIANSTCGLGSPVSGSFFGVLKYKAGISAAISFKLDKPMTVGKAYSFTISYKAEAGQNAGINAALRYGYSHDSLSSDSFVALRTKITGTAWVKDTLSITPKTATQFVWIEVSALAGDDFILHLDDLNMLLPTTGISDENTGTGITISPNPTADKATLLLGSRINMPCTVAVYDATGRQVVLKNNHSDKTLTLYKNELGTGMYFIKLTDADNQVYNTKLLMQ